MSGGVMWMRGMPFRATRQDIVNFFAGFSIPRGSEGVHITKHPDGRPNGASDVRADSHSHV